MDNYTKQFSKQFWLLVLLITSLSGCNHNNAITQPTESEATTVSETLTATDSPTKICPIPPAGKIPGYQPGKVEPSLSQKTIQIISPILDEGDRNFYTGLRQQPIQFCGTAKDNIINVKLFATGAYIYEQKYPDPSEPTLLLGEATVENGVWFIAHEFKEDVIGKRYVLARGYDANDQPVEETGIFLTIADINPGF